MNADMFLFLIKVSYNFFSSILYVMFSLILFTDSFYDKNIFAELFFMAMGWGGGKNLCCYCKLDQLADMLCDW
jgi:hypothetical protein